MSPFRLSLVCAAVLVFGVEPARAQYLWRAPYGAPAQFQYPWWNAAPSYPYGGYPYGGYPYGGYPYGGVAPYGVGPYAGLNSSLIPLQQPLGVKQPRARATLSPAISYGEFLAYEQANLGDAKARFTVYLPATATLSINGKQMTQSGAERTFVTPRFEGKDKSHTFVFEATWKDEFGMRTQVVTVQARPGMSYDVRFPKRQDD